MSPTVPVTIHVARSIPTVEAWAKAAFAIGAQAAGLDFWKASVRPPDDQQSRDLATRILTLAEGLGRPESGTVQLQDPNTAASLRHLFAALSEYRQGDVDAGIQACVSAFLAQRLQATDPAERQALWSVLSAVRPVLSPSCFDAALGEYCRTSLLVAAEPNAALNPRQEEELQHILPALSSQEVIANLGLLLDAFDRGSMSLREHVSLRVQGALQYSEADTDAARRRIQERYFHPVAVEHAEDGSIQSASNHVAAYYQNPHQQGLSQTLQYLARMLPIRPEDTLNQLALSALGVGDLPLAQHCLARAGISRMIFSDESVLLPAFGNAESPFRVSTALTSLATLMQQGFQLPPNLSADTPTVLAKIGLRLWAEAVSAKPPPQSLQFSTDIFRQFTERIWAEEVVAREHLYRSDSFQPQRISNTTTQVARILVALAAEDPSQLITLKGGWERMLLKNPYLFSFTALADYALVATRHDQPDVFDSLRSGLARHFRGGSSKAGQEQENELSPIREDRAADIGLKFALSGRLGVKAFVTVLKEINDSRAPSSGRYERYAEGHTSRAIAAAIYNSPEIVADPAARHELLKLFSCMKDREVLASIIGICQAGPVYYPASSWPHAGTYAPTFETTELHAAAVRRGQDSLFDLLLELEPSTISREATRQLRGMAQSASEVSEKLAEVLARVEWTARLRTGLRQGGNLLRRLIGGTEEAA